MPEIITELDIESTYNKLKGILLKNKCKVLIEHPPTHILAKQGSLNGITPMNAKKKINYQLAPIKTNTKDITKITVITTITSDWKNLTLYGNILAAVIAAIFLWIASDINNYIVRLEPGYWTWLAQIYASPNTIHVMFMVNVFRVLGIFLIAAIAAEILIVIYVYPRKDMYAQHTLKTLLIS